MSETRDLLVASAERLFGEHCDKSVVEAAEAGEFPHRLWQAIEEAGFASALVSEAAGGAGVEVTDALAVLKTAAAFSAPVPLAETMLARWLLAGSGLVAEDGPYTLAPVVRQDELRLARDGGAWRLSGDARRVPWGRHARVIVVLAQGPDGPMVARVPAEGVRHVPGKNIAGEPRDDIAFDVGLAADAAASAPQHFGRDRLIGFGAALRSIQIAGALARVLDITVRYAQERVQFGRPIGKFQAIQQNLAVLAGHAAAAGAAADLAAEAIECGSFDPVVIGAAKARTGEAASVGVSIAHQVHGAIGFTKEHPLNHSTRRLWSWRDEFGPETTWNRVVGDMAAKAGAGGLWRAITAAGATAGA
jgi:acyl-CoA dehydrogenase